ncbi:hypothetical protein IAU59_004960 [Kwoniella sp. CBS 9459]
MEVDVPSPALSQERTSGAMPDQPSASEHQASPVDVEAEILTSPNPEVVSSPSPLTNNDQSPSTSATPSSATEISPPPSNSQAPVIDLSDTPSPSPSKSEAKASPSPLKRDSTSITHLEDLQTSRPAPASPASSRPSSALFDTSAARERSGSSASAGLAGGGGGGIGLPRRVSSASSSRGSTGGSGSAAGSQNRNRSTSRAGSTGQGRSIARPKSMLGTTITLPEPSYENDPSSSSSSGIAIARQGADEEEKLNLNLNSKKHDSIPEYPQSNIVTEHQVQGDTPAQHAGDAKLTANSTSTSTSTRVASDQEHSQRDLSVPPSQARVKGDSETSSFVMAAQPEASSSSTPTTALSSALEIQVIVRDFAFESSDERYHGRGVINLRESASSVTGFKWPWQSGAGAGADEQSSSSSAGPAGGGRGAGWGGFGLIGGWRGFGNRANQSAGREDDDDDDEDQEDDDDGDDEDYRIGGVGGRGGREADERYYSSPAQSDSRSVSDQEEDSQMDDDGFNDDRDRDESRISGSIHLNETESGSTNYRYKILPLLPESEEPSGHYRASYPFEALSSSEMTLVEGDLLKISGRGNGDPGWVIARKVVLGQGGQVEGVEERVGLVPEGYLERVEVVQVE